MPWPTPDGTRGSTGRGSPPRPSGWQRSEPRSTRRTASASWSPRIRWSPLSAGRRQPTPPPPTSGSCRCCTGRAPMAWCRIPWPPPLDRLRRAAGLRPRLRNPGLGAGDRARAPAHPHRLLVRAKKWEGAERTRSSLLRGQDLAQAEACLGASLSLAREHVTPSSRPRSARPTWARATQVHRPHSARIQRYASSGWRQRSPGKRA